MTTSTTANQGVEGGGLSVMGAQITPTASLPPSLPPIHTD